MAAGAASYQNWAASQNTASTQRSQPRDSKRPDSARPESKWDNARPYGASSAAARRHRAELLHTITRFERALAVPDDDVDWRREVDDLLRGLREAFDEHVAVTEGPDGLYGELVDHAPRLARGIECLQREHAALLASMDGLHGRVRRPDPTIEQIRGWACALLEELWSHRQRGADLVYEAYATDIGGET